MIKAGVDLRGLKPQMAVAYTIACGIYKAYRGPCVITSASDGVHGANSLHYQGLALDLRTKMFDAAERLAIHRDLQTALGVQFDVVLEEDHLHLEFQPKEPATGEA